MVFAQEAPVEPKKTERQQMDSILQRELSNQPFQKEEAPQEQENGWFWQLMKTSATLGVVAIPMRTNISCKLIILIFL